MPSYPDIVRAIVFSASKLTYNIYEVDGRRMGVGGGGLIKQKWQQNFIPTGFL
jgi:hypothetical protein